MSAPASSEEEYHSADETRGESDVADAATLSRDLERSTLSEGDENDREVHPTDDVGASEEVKTQELTEEEIEVHRYLTPHYTAILPVCTWQERKKEAGRLKAEGNDVFKRGGTWVLLTSILHPPWHVLSREQTMQRQ